MFDEYVNQITDEIELVNQSILEVKDFLEENKDAKIESIDSDDSIELSAESLILIDDEDNILQSLNDNFEIMAINLETIVNQNNELLESVNISDQHNVQGYWFLFISIVVIVGLKIFLDNIMKW